jgi:hypothetical protein
MRSPLVVGVCGALVLASGVGALVLGVGQGPDAVAKDYLASLAKGDVGHAVSLSRHAKKLDRTLLSKPLPKGSRITRPTTGALTVKGDHAKVEASYVLDSSKIVLTLPLTKHDGDWTVDNGITPLQITGAPDEVTFVTINGTKVPVHAGTGQVPVVPGVYRTVVPKTFAYSADAPTSPVNNDPGYVSIRLGETPAGKLAAEKAVLHKLATCLATARQLEDPCGARTTHYIDKADFIDTDIHWRLTRAPRVLATIGSDGYSVITDQPGSADESFLATDRKHRYPPLVLHFTSKVWIEFATVTFKGMVPTVTLG